MPHYLLTAKISEPGMTLLHAAGKVSVLASLKGDDAKPVLADADALIARTEPVDRALLSAAAKLRIVVRHGVGYDNVDVAAASALGIPVAYLPAINSDAVAEHAFSLLFELTKRTGAWSRKVAERDWGCRYGSPNVGLAGKTLGIVGLGSIGRMIARRAAAFDMAIVAHDPYVSAEQGRAVGAEMLDIETLLARSDVVTLHTPGSAQTKNLLDAARIGRMKKTAFLINTARGTLVDLTALDAALREGRLAGAGLDVFPAEPPDFSHPIFSNPRLVATPHIASNTAETIDKMGVAAAQTAIDALAGKKPAALADPNVWPPKRG